MKCATACARTELVLTQRVGWDGQDCPSYKELTTQRTPLRCTRQRLCELRRAAGGVKAENRR
jgi:hypothetical protein